MPLTTAGRNFIAGLITGHETLTYNEARARIGVGNSAATESAAHTDLQGTKIRVGMESGYPTRSTNALTFRSEFGTAVGNFAWEEWGVFNDASAGTMLNRKAEALGTKASGSTWVLTVTVTVTLG